MFWFPWLLSLAFREVASIRSSIEVTTSKSGSFSLANEKGVTVSDRNSILFTVKACSDAVIVLSDIASISDKQGNYFLLMIGKSGNSSQVMDSCFTCPRTRVVPGNFVDCNVAKPFWLHWDGTGLFEFGKGRVIGRETSLTMNGRNGTYMTNFLQITSTGSTPAVFSFEKDSPLTFTSPKQDGSSIVSVNETTPVNSTLLMISESPSSSNITMSVAGEGHEFFYVEGRELRVKKQLDYETTTYYALVVTSDVGKSVAVLISVVDVNDETPSLSISRHVDIPEEVSVGTVFGGIYNVSDLDEGDNLTLTLSGNASTLLEATGEGHLKVINRLDRDGPEGTTYIKNVTLTVTDVIGHTVSAMFDLNVLDINDNSPVCKLDYHNRSIEENNQDDIILMNLTTICDDMDDGENGNLTYTVLGEEWVMSSFAVQEGALVARTHGLDRENTSQCDVTTFFVLVKDNAKRVRRKTYIHVNLKVIPVNEFPPRWNAARTGGPDKLDTIHVYSAAPTGSVIANLAATDEDVGDGPLVYSIAAIKTAEGKDGFNLLSMDNFTGAMSVKNSLTGVKSLLVNVVVSDGKHKVKATVSVSVSSLSANSKPVSNTALSPLGPDFDKRLYTIDAPSLTDKGRSVLTFTMRNVATWHAVRVDSASVPFFSIRNINDWQLVFSGTYDGQTPIPNIVHLIVHNTKTNLDLSTSYVVLKQKKCGTTSKSDTSHSNDGKASKSNMNHLIKPRVATKMAEHLSGDTSSQMRDVNPGIKPKAQLCMPAYSMTTKLLMAACGGQGAILGGVLMIYVCKRLGGEKKSTVVPVRKDPIGCDEVCGTKEIPRKTPQLLEKSGRGSHSKQLKEDAPFEEDPTDMIIDLEDKENDDQVGDVTTNICGDEGGTLIETGGEEIDETEDGSNDDKGDDNQVMPEEVNTAGEEVDTETQPPAGSDIEGEPDLGDVKEDTFEEGNDEKDGHITDRDRMRHDREDVKDDTFKEGDDEKDGHITDRDRMTHDREDVKKDTFKEGDDNKDGHSKGPGPDPDRMRHDPSGLSGDVDDEEKVDVESPGDDEMRMVEGDSLRSLRETADQVRAEPSLDNDDNIYNSGNEESNAGTYMEEGSESDTRFVSEDIDTRELPTSELKPEVIIEEPHPEVSEGLENLTVPDNSEASDEENEKMEEDEDETENDEEEDEEDDEVTGDVAVTSMERGEETEAMGEGGEVVKKRRKIRKVKKEKPKKEKKPKIRKIDFTQSPYNFQTKETKE